MAFPYVPNYGGNWQTGAGGATPITEAALDNLETQFQSVIDLLTNRGDTIYRGAATWERLAKGVAGQFLEQGANDPFWADIVEATREFFVPIAGGTDIVYQGALINGGADFAVMHLLVPHDFTGITNIEVIFTPTETGASMNFVIQTFYGAYNGGEDWNVHTETADPRDIGATVADQNLAHSISDLVNVAALAVGDLLTVRVAFDAAAVDSNAYVKGLRFKYT